MSWREDIVRELKTARQAREIGNHGKARTCARRAVGIAATELQMVDPDLDLGPDFIAQVRAIAANQTFKEDTRGAAERLAAKIRGDFTSASVDPISDAETILAELRTRIGKFQARSSDR